MPYRKRESQSFFPKSFLVGKAGWYELYASYAGHGVLPLCFMYPVEEVWESLYFGHNSVNTLWIERLLLSISDCLCLQGLIALAWMDALTLVSACLHIFYLSLGFFLRKTTLLRWSFSLCSAGMVRAPGAESLIMLRRFLISE